MTHSVRFIVRLIWLPELVARLMPFNRALFSARAFQARQFAAQMFATAFLGDDPRAGRPRRIVAHVLSVATLEVGDPMALLIPMKADNPPGNSVQFVRHAFSTRSNAAAQAAVPNRAPQLRSRRRK